MANLAMGNAREMGDERIVEFEFRNNKFLFELKNCFL